MKAGDRVRIVPSHPFRALEWGELVKWDEKKRRWLVEFVPRVGAGFEGGKFLLFDEKSFCELKGGTEEGTFDEDDK